MRKMPFLRAKAPLLWILILQLVLTPAAFASSPQRSYASQNSTQNLNDPFLDLIESQATALQQIRALPSGDPVLDIDPFFLRSQSWVAPLAVTDSDEDPTVLEGEQSLTLQAPGAPRALQLRFDHSPRLRIVGFTDEYFFLAAAHVTRESPFDEGLFVLRYQDVLAARGPVPIFFFPLPGGHWSFQSQGQVLAPQLQEWPTHHLVVISNHLGESLPVDLEDVSRVVEAESLNLMLAQIDALPGLLEQPRYQQRLLHLKGAFQQNLSNQAAIQGVQQFISEIQSESILPKPGSTAGFGVFYNGFKSSLETSQEQGRLERSSSAHSSLKLLQNASRSLWSVLGLPSAYAVGIMETQVQTFSQQVLRFGVISSIALIASVLLKYTAFRGYFQKKHACESDLQKKTPAWKREAKEIGDVAAHTFNTVGQFAPVWFGNIVEFAGDRFFPKQFAGHNRIMRKILEKTVYAARENAERLPVSLMTWAMALVGGTVDTASYYVQLYYAVPAVIATLGVSMPFIASRMREGFSVGDPQLADLNRYEIMRCGEWYFNSGASIISQGWRQQLLPVVIKDTNEEMLAEGLNPHDPSHNSEKERRIENKLSEFMKKQGLPSDIIFDANTLYGGLLNFFGYSIPLESGDTKTASSYWGRQRPGLIPSAVHEALKQARYQLNFTPQIGRASCRERV